MKIILTFLILSFSTSVVFGQADAGLIDKFSRLFNEGKHDSIGHNFSAQAKMAMPVEKTKVFLGQVYNRFGKINTAKFERQEGDFRVYKVTMDKGDLTLRLSTNSSGEWTGMYAQPYTSVVAKMPRNITPMSLPFKGQWNVFWGGDTQTQNYHVSVPFQKNAFDIVINGSDGKSYKTDGKANEDYYVFGQEILSPCDGEVVWAVDGIKDNIPGQQNKMFIPGNSVLIKAPGGEYAFLAHFKQYTVKVKQGDKVKKGQLLGLCGNSGNSSEPHLHFHLQDDENFEKAIGIKCYFEKLQVSGKAQTDYSPVKGDAITSTKK